MTANDVRAPRTTSRPLRVLGIVLLCGLAGIAVFAVLVWRAVTVEDAPRAEAERRIAAARAGLPSKAPLVDLDDQGRVVRMTAFSAGTVRPIARLKALAWHAADQRLVSADTPFWFFKLKGPAARYALTGTGFDLDRLGLTPADLERFGPGVIVDYASRDGDHLFVWTE
jgi:hypothetical protein